MESSRAWRYPGTTAVIGLAVLGLLFLVALNVERLPIIGDGALRHAHFSEVSGLAADAEVRVAGVKVGTVTDVELDGDHVDVSFTTGDAWIGDRSTAAIKVGNLLGSKYLAIEPLGNREQSKSEPIPLDRTASLYDVLTAFQDLSTTLDRIDTDQLARSFTAMTETFRNTPDEVHGTLEGLSALSTTIASRDQQLRELLDNAENVSGAVSSRNADFERLLADGNELLEAVHARREVIHSLLVGTQRLSKELNGLVAENSAQLDDALASLDGVTALLARNQQNLDRALHDMAPFLRLASNALGSGRWADAYLCGLLPPSVGPVNPQGCEP